MAIHFVCLLVKGSPEKDVNNMSEQWVHSISMCSKAIQVKPFDFCIGLFYFLFYCTLLAQFR